MANDYNVIVIDDERNADRRTDRDHRPGAQFGGPRRLAPGGAIVVPPRARPTLIQSGGAASRPYYSPSPQPTMVYHQPAPRAGLAGMDTAELIEVASQILAAIQPLPGAPTAQGDVETDVENLVIYQTALATHAKRDEQLRTLGGLLGRLLRK